MAEIVASSRRNTEPGRRAALKTAGAVAAAGAAAAVGSPFLRNAAAAETTVWKCQTSWPAGVGLQTYKNWAASWKEQTGGELELKGFGAKEVVGDFELFDGVKTLAEFVALARSKPGELSYASTGAGSASHLAGEMFNQRAGVEIVHVPYKGGSQVMVDLLSGRVGAYYSTPATAAPHVQAGKLVAIATTGLERPSFQADVPTIAESGFKDFNATNWYAFVAPARTPEPILERWNVELVKALRSPDVREQLLGMGLIPEPGTREALRDFIAKESATWAQVIKERKITAE